MEIQIEKSTVRNLKTWFSDYVLKYKEGDKKLRRNAALKEAHTKRVCGEILQLGARLGLTREELRLAEIIALFHDIGRFEQYAGYGTFADSKSEDHAELGLKILKKNGILNGFDNPTKSLVFRAIKYHNRATVPQKETKTCLLFAKLLRDADKLDIWTVVIEYYHRTDGGRNSAIELDLPDTPGVSERVYRAIMNERIVDMNHVKNLNDFKVLQMGWIFDINFKPTLDCIKKRRYLEMVRDVLPKTAKIRKIYDVTRIYRAHRSKTCIG